MHYTVASWTCTALSFILTTLMLVLYFDYSEGKPTPTPTPTPKPITRVQDVHAPPPDHHIAEEDIYKLFPALKGVHPDLVRLADQARYHAHFLVYEGCRTLAKQKEYFAKGVTWTLHSLHLTKPCRAIDVVFLKADGSAVWTPLQAAVTNAFLWGFGKGLGIQCLGSGVSWDDSIYVAANTTRDFFHLEIDCKKHGGM